MYGEMLSGAKADAAAEVLQAGTEDTVEASEPVLNDKDGCYESYGSTATFTLTE